MFIHYHYIAFALLCACVSAKGERGWADVGHFVSDPAATFGLVSLEELWNRAGCSFFLLLLARVCVCVCVYIHFLVPCCPNLRFSRASLHLWIYFLLLVVLPRCFLLVSFAFRPQAKHIAPTPHDKKFATTFPYYFITHFRIVHACVSQCVCVCVRMFFLYCLYLLPAFSIFAEKTPYCRYF